MQTRLEHRAEQRLALVPEMLRSVEILQLAAHELCALIAREVEDNETLLWRPARGAASGDATGAIAFAEAAPPDLRAWLRLQLAWRGCSDTLTERVLALADLLDERGLLPQSDAELAAALPGDWFDPLAVLQTLEPRGVGARTGVEAMLLQVDGADPDCEDIAALLTEHLDALARNRVPQVAKALDLDVCAVEHLIERIKAFNPRPASPFSTELAAPLSIELDAHFEDGEVVVRLRGGDLPELRVHPHYAKLARSGDATLRRYLRPKLAAARGLIRAVDQRRRTLLRVSGAILQRQAAFLLHGVRRMQPLRMAEVASDLGCHTSTVSRAIAGKWVGTIHGAYSLRGFFDGGLNGSSAPAQTAALTSPVGLGQRGVQERVRELVAAEDPARPLADDQIAVLLRSEGIEIARRTVAKYRADLGIRSQWRRRSLSQREPAQPEPCPQTM